MVKLRPGRVGEQRFFGAQRVDADAVECVDVERGAAAQMVNVEFACRLLLQLLRQIVFKNQIAVQIGDIGQGVVLARVREIGVSAYVPLQTGKQGDVVFGAVEQRLAAMFGRSGYSV